jgi:uncharacterized protein involved in response to NO
MQTEQVQRRIKWDDLGKEPFRIFFPAGVLAGLIGVALWPLYFSGVSDWYPGQNHARIMAYGLFGGFIFGFLGTAMPRMLSAKPLMAWQAITFLAVHAAMVLSFAASKLVWGDVLFLILVSGFGSCLAVRARQRKDTPPPGFVLLGLAFICVATGTILAILQNYRELNYFWVNLHRLLSYQGFVLLPILGIGPFILPRFFGMKSQHDFAEALVPSPEWARKAVLALVTGALIVASFFIEAAGWHRIAHSIRFVTTLGYLLSEMPFHRAPSAGSALGASIRIAFVVLLAGFLAVAIFPGYRVGLLHLTLIGGFAVITFVVATRVVFGHSGNLERLKGRNRWLLIAVGLMLLGMATRISGDLWPKLMISHYVYGALLWIGGVLLWACFVLPKVLVAESESD